MNIITYNGSVPRVPVFRGVWTKRYKTSCEVDTVGIKDPSGKFHGNFPLGSFSIMLVVHCHIIVISYGRGKGVLE
ncbi:MAG: hypothetical protein H6Q73_3673 [Firmicutes bacterium]|nr:hypothetical protein [Bacillota bacterium]